MCQRLIFIHYGYIAGRVSDLEELVSFAWKLKSLLGVIGTPQVMGEVKVIFELHNIYR